MDASVSVIVPFYNGSRYFEAALDSVRRQTWAPSEIIVVDDGSSAAEAEFLRRYQNECRIIRQANQGVSAARNTAIGHATGIWLAFLDQDDVWAPQKLEMQMSYAANDPECAAIHTAVWVQERNGRITLYRKHALTLDDFLYNSVGGAYLSSTVVRRSVAMNVGLFDPTLHMKQDHDFFLRVARYRSFHYVDKPLCTRRLHASNQSSDWLRVWEEAVRIVRHYVDWYPCASVHALQIAKLNAEFALQSVNRRDAASLVRIIRRATGRGTTWRALLGQMIEQWNVNRRRRARPCEGQIVTGTSERANLEQSLKPS